MLVRTKARHRRTRRSTVLVEALVVADAIDRMRMVRLLGRGAR